MIFPLMRVLPTDLDQAAPSVYHLPLKAEDGSEWICRSYRCGDIDETGNTSQLPFKYPEGWGVNRMQRQPWKGESPGQALYSIPLLMGTQGFGVSTEEAHANIFKVDNPLALIHAQRPNAALSLGQISYFPTESGPIWVA